MKIEYFIADVFTKQLFNGAQIAVFPHADGLSTITMQLLARELNLSESVFVFHSEMGAANAKCGFSAPKRSTTLPVTRL